MLELSSRATVNLRTSDPSDIIALNLYMAGKVRTCNFWPFCPLSWPRFGSKSSVCIYCFYFSNALLISEVGWWARRKTCYTVPPSSPWPLFTIATMDSLFVDVLRQLEFNCYRL